MATFWELAAHSAYHMLFSYMYIYLILVTSQTWRGALILIAPVPGRYFPFFISARPSKLIRTELSTMSEENLGPADLKSVRQALYRRRKKYPKISKSREETMDTLAMLSPITSKGGGDFLLVNDRETGTVIFSCPKNLKCLCYENIDLPVGLAALTCEKNTGKLTPSIFL